MVRISPVPSPAEGRPQRPFVCGLSGSACGTSRTLPFRFGAVYRPPPSLRPSWRGRVIVVPKSPLMLSSAALVPTRVFTPPSLHTLEFRLNKAADLSVEDGRVRAGCRRSDPPRSRPPVVVALKALTTGLSFLAIFGVLLFLRRRKPDPQSESKKKASPSSNSTDQKDEVPAPRIGSHTKEPASSSSSSEDLLVSLPFVEIGSYPESETPDGLSAESWGDLKECPFCQVALTKENVCPSCDCFWGQSKTPSPAPSPPDGKSPRPPLAETTSGADVSSCVVEDPRPTSTVRKDKSDREPAPERK